MEKCKAVLPINGINLHTVRRENWSKSFKIRTRYTQMAWLNRNLIYLRRELREEMEMIWLGSREYEKSEKCIYLGLRSSGQKKINS